MTFKTWPADLAPGTVTVTNTSTKEKHITLYVPNKDNVDVVMPASATVDIETASAGETAHYLALADGEITTTFTAKTSGDSTGGGGGNS